MDAPHEHLPPPSIKKHLEARFSRVATFTAVLAFALACAMGLSGFGACFGFGARAAFAEPVQVTLSVPTEVPCAVLADGTVVGPSSWSVSSPVDAPANLSGVSVSGAPDGVSFSTVKGDGSEAFSYSDGAASLSGGLAVPARGSASLSWDFSQLDAVKNSDLLAASAVRAAQLCAVSLTFSAEPVAFAVYSDDDKSLRFYKRTVVPEAGDVFEGRTVTEVYTGIEEAEYVPTASDNNDDPITTPWYGRRLDVKSVSVVDSGIKPKSLNYWFQHFENCESFDLAKLDTSRVAHLGHVFRDCFAVSSIDLSNWDLSHLEGVDGPFADCFALRSVDLGNFNESRPKSLYALFFHCKSLTSYRGLDGIDTSACENFNSVFDYCESLSELDLTGWDMSAAKTAMYMFSGMDSLETVKFGDKWRWVGSDCYLPSPSASHIDAADGKWYDVTNGTGYSPSGVPSGAGTYSARPGAYATLFADGALVFTRGSSVSDLAATHGDVAGGPWHFDEENGIHTTYETSRVDVSLLYPWSRSPYSKAIKTIECRDTIRPKNCAWMFHFDSNCTSIDLSKFDMSRCMSTQRMFSGCYGISEYKGLDSWDMSHVVNMIAMFDGNWGSTSYPFLKNWDISNVKAFGWMFYNNRNLRELDLSNWTISSRDMSYQEDGDFSSGAILGGFSNGNPSSFIKISVGVSSSALGGQLFFDTISADIANADGKWYAAGSGAAYLPSSIPVGVAETYYSTPKQAFAVYSADDNSLNFYKRWSDEVPAAGGSFNGKAASEVYTGIESDVYQAEDGTSFNGKVNTPWYGHVSDITSIEVVDPGIRPKSMAFWFQHLSAVTSISGIGKLDASACTSTQHMFCGVYSYAGSLDFTGWDTSALENFDAMFTHAEKVSSIDFTGCDLSAAKSFGWVFDNCHALKSVKGLDSGTQMRPTSISALFACCTHLEAVDLSRIATGSVTPGYGTSNMFTGCYTLRAVTLGASFSFLGDGTLTGEAVGGLPTISAANVAGADGKWYAASDGAAYAGDAIPANKADTYYAVAPSVFAVYSADDASLDFYNRAGKPVAGEVWQGKAATAVYAGFEDAAFVHAGGDVTDRVPCQSWGEYANAVTAVEVVDSGIRPKSMNYWFYCFSNMATCDVAKLDTSRCEGFQYAWLYCLAMKSIDLSRLDTSACTDFAGMFDATGLETVDVSNFDVSKCGDFSVMFAYSPALTSVRGLDKWQMKPDSYFNGMFMHDYSLTSIDGVASWNVSHAKNLEYMFRSCSSLSIDLSAWTPPSDLAHEYFNLGAPGVVPPACWTTAQQDAASPSAAVATGSADLDVGDADDAAPGAGDVSASGEVRAVAGSNITGALDSAAGGDEGENREEDSPAVDASGDESLAASPRDDEA